MLAANHGYHGIPGVPEQGKLSVSGPYVVITPGQADQWRRRRFQPQVSTDLPDKGIADPFPESHLTLLSSVLLNADKTFAKVYVSNLCGTLCGFSEWKFLEKRNGAWNILPAPDCCTTY